MTAEVQAALAFAVRTAVDNKVTLDELVRAISVEYSNAQKTGKPLRTAGQGSFVEYWHAKYGLVTAHVLEVGSDNHLRLKLHRGAAVVDEEVPNAPFSERPLKGHWSFR